MITIEKIIKEEFGIRDIEMIVKELNELGFYSEIENSIHLINKNLQRITKDKSHNIFKKTTAKYYKLNSCSNSTSGFIWNDCGIGAFDKFLDMLSDFEVCNPKKFKLLFEIPRGRLNISLNSSNPNFVLQFLCCLKESKFISSYNTKGFYQVLRDHVKDFDTIFLKNRSPQRRVDTVKNLVSWEENKRHIETALKRLI